MGIIVALCIASILYVHCFRKDFTPEKLDKVKPLILGIIIFGVIAVAINVFL